MADVFQIAQADAEVVIKDAEALGAEVWNFIKGAIASAKTGGLLTYLGAAGQFLQTVEKTAAADLASLEGSLAGEIGTLSADATAFNAGKPVGFEISLPVLGAVTVVLQKGSPLSPTPPVA